MAFRMVNSCQKVFHLFCPNSPEESVSIAAITLQNVFPKKIRLENQNDSSIHGLKNGCCVSGHVNNISSRCTPPSEVFGDQVYCQ